MAQRDVPDAYQTADDVLTGNRDGAFYGQDIAWSPVLSRYLVTNFIESVDDVWPFLGWSEYTTDPGLQHFSIVGPELGQHKFAENLPTEFPGQSRVGRRGAILHDVLGHTIDNEVGPSGQRSVFHLYYEASTQSEYLADRNNYHVLDIDHILIFANYPQVSLQAANVQGSEGSGGNTTFNFTLSLSGPSGLPTSVQVHTMSGSAAAGVDYAPLNQTVVFAPFETSKQVGITIHGDLIDESNETFTILLSNATNAAAPVTSYTVTILNDDQARAGDYDLDSDVDGRDFLVWQRTYGTSNPASDGNHDGVVNSGDLTIWQNNYGVGALDASTIAAISAGETLPHVGNDRYELADNSSVEPARSPHLAWSLLEGLPLPIFSQKLSIAIRSIHGNHFDTTLKNRIVQANSSDAINLQDAVFAGSPLYRRSSDLSDLPSSEPATSALDWVFAGLFELLEHEF
jgi:hypothetical protein